QLKQRKNEIRIVGHTDSVPIVKPDTKKKYPYGNVQLSTDRALAVFDYLKTKGVDENRMCITGYGPHKPLVENNSTENKRRNRRVEIILGE
ncbi:MAG: OmpA family protein, partial [Planctomycetota bacterium]